MTARFFLIFTLIACSSVPKHVLTKNESGQYNLSFNQDYKYRVDFDGYSSLKGSGNTFSLNDASLQYNQNNYALKDVDQIVEYTTVKKGHYWLEGLLIGLGTGLVAGAATTGIITATDDSGYGLLGGILIIMPLSLILGTGIGLGTGFLIPKHKKNIYRNK